METKENNKIVIHPVDVDLWKKVKSCAAIEDKTIGEMVNTILEEYFKNKR